MFTYNGTAIPLPRKGGKIMHAIDFHCDTLMRLYDLQSAGNQQETLWKNTGHIDLERLVAAGHYAQFFACFLWLEGKPVQPTHYLDALAMADLFHRELAQHPQQVAFAASYADYLANKRAGKLSAFLTVEEGGILEGDLSRLDALYQKGVRILTLTWNFENCLGYPNAGLQYQHQGLKPFGLEALERMEELGIVVDVSHLSDGGFADVLHHSKRPFLATHSNARSICGHERNLTDEMIRQLAEKGGVTGLNLCGAFLQDNGQSTIDAMLRQMRHILDVGGAEVLCLGTDFDGVEDLLEIQGCQDLGKLVDAMEHSGFTASEIEAVCYQNAERFLKNYWGIESI